MFAKLQNFVFESVILFVQMTKGVTPLGLAVTQLQASMQMLSFTLGDALTPVLVPLIEFLAGLAMWFSELDPDIQAAAAVVVVFMTALTGVVATLGLLAVGFLSIAGVLGITGGAILGFVATALGALLLIPIVVGLLVLIWLKFGDQIIAGVNFIIGGFIWLAKAAWDLLVAIGKFVVDAIIWFVKLGIDVLAAIGKFVVDAIVWFVKLVVDVLAAIGKFIIDVVVFFVKLGIDILAAIGKFVVDVLVAIGKFVVDVLTKFGELVTKGVEKFNELKDKVVTLASNLASEGLKAGTGFVQALIDGINQKVKDLLATVTDVAAKVRKKLPFSDAQEGPLSTLTESGRSIPETIARGMLEGASALSSVADSVFAGAALTSGVAGGTPAGVGGGTTIGDIVVSINTPAISSNVDVDNLARKVSETIVTQLRRKNNLGGVSI
jgi:hypothetical protein